MRTTLSLDEDIARLLAKQRKKSGGSFKAVVNHYLRLGLSVGQQAPAKAFVVQPRKLGLPAGLAYDHVDQLLEAIEGAARR